jgi:16S rRNA (cytosine967-C5)-methyltransferase
VPQIDAPRRVAYDVLAAVRERDAYVNLTLPALLRERRIGGRDAAFATELTHGTIRGQGTYDVVIDSLTRHDLDPRVRDVVRLGVHQLLGMRTPTHAAVSTSVELVRQVVGPRPTGLVNAMLRKVSQRELSAWVDRLAPSRADDIAGHLAVRHSHPRWVVEAFAQALGGDWAETEALLVADNTAPQVSLVARPGRSTVDELLAQGADPGRWSPYAATWPSGDPGGLAAVRQGRAGAQDEGSQLVAIALARADVEGSDARWLDMCAGPGGKSALLAALAAERGARLLASELQPHRARLVRQALGDSDGVLGVVVADGRRPAWSHGLDRVLVDAPCTGLGALRRRPEARWRRQAPDVAQLVELQCALLERALDSCRPGGIVVYATCSPVVEETRGVVGAVVSKRADVSEEDARPLLAGVPDLGPGPHAQLWPHRHGTDAMFVALLRRH